MTKKSAARLKRDAEQKAITQIRRHKNTQSAYTDLEQYYATAMDSIKKYGTMGAMLREHAHLIPYLNNADETRDSAITLSRDLKRFKDMIDNHHDKHKGRVGAPRDNEDTLRVIDLTQKYGELLESMSDCCSPVATALTDDFQVAQDRYDIANGKEPRTIAKAMATGSELKVETTDGKMELKLVENTETPVEIESVNLVPANEATPQQTTEQPKA